MSSWRKGVEKPADEVVEVEVEPIITVEEFEEVQAIMRSRSPQLRAPRFVSGPTLLGGVAFCADCGGAMTLRTSGKGTEYRYYTCCTAARQGPKGCKGRSIPMDELNDLVVSSVVDRLLSPHFLEEALSALLKRRDEAAERETGRIVALKRNALDAENKLTRLYEAIEAGLADLTDSNLKGRIAELKRIRDSAQADVERAEGRRGGRMEITPEALRTFAAAAKDRMRGEDGSFRRNYIQQLVQRAEVGTDEIRIVGSRARLLQTLVASGGKPGVETAAHGVRSFDLKWLPG